MLRIFRSILCLAALAAVFGCEPNNQGYAPEQPIQYSHAVHAGAMKIPCQYCHYAAERSRYAGIPPAKVCLNCHEVVKKDLPEIQKVREAVASGTPIEWVRVHRVPDHVYFDHSVHVNDNAKGAWQTCHGPVEEMGRVTQWAPLTMGWCIQCHRDNSPVPPGQQAGTPVRASPLTDCAVCHH